MAYALKYILRYETDLYKNDFRILISENGYIGDPSYKKIGAGHVQLSKQKDGKIAGTALDFSIQADTDFEYDSFFASGNKAFKIELEYKGTTIWSGYNVTDQHSEPYVAPPYDVQIMATDGLGLLKTEAFELTGMVSRFTAIRYILDKIGLNLGYLVNIVLFEQNMSAPYINMLDQLYFQAEIFAGKTCYEVLQSLLPEETAITQHENRWLIERKADAGNYRYKFTSAGVYESDYTEQKINLLGTIADTKAFTVDADLTLYPIGYLNRDFQAAWKNFTIKQIYGKKNSFFRNADFTKGTASWTETGATGMLQAIELDKGTFGFIKGTQTTSPLTKYISQSVYIKATDTVIFSFDYSPVGYKASGSPPNITLSSTNIPIHFKMKFVGASGTTYWHNLDKWQTTEVTNKIETVKTDIGLDSIDFKTFKLVGSKFPENGTFTFIIYQIYLPILSPMIYFAGLALNNVNLYTQNIALFSDSEETKVNLSEDATEEGKVIELMPVDLPEYDNADQYFTNGNYYNDGGNYLPTSRWTAEGLTYLSYTAAFIANQYCIPRTILKGTLVGKDISLNNCIKHIYNGNKKFYIEQAQWNIIENTIDVEICEIAPALLLEGVEVQTPFNPLNTYNNLGDLLDFTTIGNEGSYTKPIDGNWEGIIPGFSNPFVIGRKDSIDAYKLDPASGQPQFSLKGAIVETNVDDNANKIRINDGALISHNFNALSRTERRIVEQSATPYDPTREWTIAQEDITLPNNNLHFLYIKVPIEPEV